METKPVLRSHPLCDNLFDTYMRIRKLTPEDPPDVREEHYKKAREAWNQLVQICKQYYFQQGEEYADVVCLSLDIYRLEEVCLKYYQ
jgi:hypothetical protein